MGFLVLPCDGIGPEITGATLQVLDAAQQAFGLDMTFDHEVVGLASLDRYGTNAAARRAGAGQKL